MADVIGARVQSGATWLIEWDKLGGGLSIAYAPDGSIARAIPFPPRLSVVSPDDSKFSLLQASFEESAVIAALGVMKGVLSDAGD